MKDPKIENRESWLKVIVVVVITAVLAYKLVLSDWSLTDFSFADLLNLLLALFAVGLSATFYFKATETSERFYANTYDFSKDISEKIGRIEERFGGQLEHIREQYADQQDWIKKMPFDSAAAKEESDAAKEELDHRKVKLEEEMEERTRIIDHFVQKAEMEENEKEELLTKLKEAELSIRAKEKEVEEMRKRIEEESVGRRLALFDVKKGDPFEFLSDFAFLHQDEKLENQSEQKVRQFFHEYLGELTSRERRWIQSRLLEIGTMEISSEGLPVLSNRGWRFVNRAARDAKVEHTDT